MIGLNEEDRDRDPLFARRSDDPVLLVIDRAAHRAVVPTGDRGEPTMYASGRIVAGRCIRSGPDCATGPRNPPPPPERKLYRVP